jgi:hypothetical protein
MILLDKDKNIGWKKENNNSLYKYLNKGIKPVTTLDEINSYYIDVIGSKISMKPNFIFNILFEIIIMININSLLINFPLNLEEFIKFFIF